jgi:autotransporter-associated beta strand protein
VGSIEGAGSYYLGAKTLTVGSNNLSTTVSGSISDCGSGGTQCQVPHASGGSLTKVGAGTLTLTGVNTYTGATNINYACNASGSSCSTLEVDGSDGHAHHRRQS